MFGVLVICALALTGTASGVDYVQNVRYLRQVGELVDRRVVDRDYNVLQPELHYLVAVGVVVRAAYDLLVCAGPVDKVYVDKLDQVVPDVLLYPQNVVKEVLALRRDVVAELKPLVDTVSRVCNGVDDDQCNRLVDVQVQSNLALKKLVKPLVLVGKVSKVAVNNDNVLEMVSENLDVLPYLVQNQKNAVKSVLVLAKLIRLVQDSPRILC